MGLAKYIYGLKAELQFPLVMSEIIGYLYYAELKGLILKYKEDGFWHFALK